MVKNREPKLRVSHSRLKTWKTNHYDHYMKYVEKLVPKAKSSPLIRGSIIHECLEAYYNGKSWKKVLDRFEKDFYQDTFEEERVMLGDIPKMARELLENYFYYYEEEDEEVEYIHNEFHFDLPLTKDINLEGYIDAVVRDKNGDIWVKDYKTYSRMKDRDFFVFNPQSAIYLWAMKELGMEAKGIIWDVIKAKEPNKPKITAKTGKVSLSKLDSTPYTVRKGIEELGFNPEDYEEFISNHRFEDYFSRYKIRMNQSTVDFFMEDVRSTAQQILERGDKDKDMNLDTTFGSSYKEIWQAEAMGMDSSYIIKKRFEKRKERNNGQEKSSK